MGRVWARGAWAIAWLTLGAGCVTPGDGRATDARAEASLARAVGDLSRSVDRDEARRVAECAYHSSQTLAREYRVLGPPLFHNFLVNSGLRNRGLCYQWTQDLALRLRALRLPTLELHWGEARAGTWREHNCLVVTARGQPFADGLVLDAWRRSGRLVWIPVRSDHYPWREASLPAPSQPALRDASFTEAPRVARIFTDR